MKPRKILKKLCFNIFLDLKIVDIIYCPREILDFLLSRILGHNKGDIKGLELLQKKVNEENNNVVRDIVYE